MTTLEFRNALVNHRFSYYNDFTYIELESTNIFFKESDEEIPFIMNATLDIRGNSPKLFHNGELMYSSYTRQLNNRAMTTGRIKEVLDASRVPLIFLIGGRRYLIGKGFLAYFPPDVVSPEILFVAVAKRDVKFMDEVKYYISRDINLTLHKKLQPVIKDFVALHRGEVVYTSRMEKFIGAKIEIPIFPSLKEQTKYRDLLISHCIKEVAKVVPKPTVKMVPEDPKKTKKKKEAELLASILRSEDDEEAGSYVTTDRAEGDMMHSGPSTDDDLPY